MSGGVWGVPGGISGVVERGGVVGGGAEMTPDSPVWAGGCWECGWQERGGHQTFLGWCGWFAAHGRERKGIPGVVVDVGCRHGKERGDGVCGAERGGEVG